MIHALLMLFFGFQVWAMLGAITLCLGVVVLDVTVGSWLHALVVILLWPVFLLLVLTHWSLIVGVTVYMAVRKLRGVKP